MKFIIRSGKPWTVGAISRARGRGKSEFIVKKCDEKLKPYGSDWATAEESKRISKGRSIGKTAPKIIGHGTDIESAMQIALEVGSVG